MPVSPPIPAPTYEEWLEEEVCGPITILALEDGRVVGAAALLERVDGLAEHGLTAVRRSHRGRGIATALKQALIHWSAEHGFRELTTWTQDGNAAMQAVNLKLGYRPRPAVINVWRPSLDRCSTSASERFQAAYDELGPRFGEWGDEIEGDPWERFLEELEVRLPAEVVCWIWAVGTEQRSPDCPECRARRRGSLRGTAPARPRQPPRRRSSMPTSASWTSPPSIRRGHRLLLGHARPPRRASGAVRSVRPGRSRAGYSSPRSATWVAPTGRTNGSVSVLVRRRHEPPRS